MPSLCTSHKTIITFVDTLNFFSETTTTTSTTPNPLPPWLTTRSALSFLPGLHGFDIELTPPPQRIPITVPELSTTTVTTTTTTTTTAKTTTSTSTTESIETTVRETDDIESGDKRTLSGVTLPTLETTLSPEGVESGDDDNETSDKLVYSTSDQDRSSIKIVLSTLPPYDTAPHTGTVSPATPMCPPRNIRALSWSWTRPGTVARQQCPPGTVGWASWTCVSSDDTVHWSPASPDLSQCQSVWMEKIIHELRKSEQILTLANDLMQYVSVNALYGGDIKSAIDAVTIIAEKMQYQLRAIPTREQREAMVMELVQSLTKIGSYLLSDDNMAAWQDLPRSQQTRFLTNFIAAIERTGSLLPGVVQPDREVSVSSDNICKSEQITFLVSTLISRYQYFTLSLQT